MKVGRNDPCPCGSKKKYKQCCLKKQTISIYEIIRKTVQESGYDDKVGDIFTNLFRYMNDKKWYGACHATCSVLYVCLAELGYSLQLCIGEAIADTLPFDHSWIVIDKKVVDLAIALPLTGDVTLPPSVGHAKRKVFSLFRSFA